MTARFPHEPFMPVFYCSGFKEPTDYSVWLRSLSPLNLERFFRELNISRRSFSPTFFQNLAPTDFVQALENVQFQMAFLVRFCSLLLHWVSFKLISTGFYSSRRRQYPGPPWIGHYHTPFHSYWRPPIGFMPSRTTLAASRPFLPLCCPWSASRASGLLVVRVQLSQRKSMYFRFCLYLATFYPTESRWHEWSHRHSWWRRRAFVLITHSAAWYGFTLPARSVTKFLPLSSSYLTTHI